VVSLQIHSWTYAEHSLTILFPRITRHIAIFLRPWTSATACNGANDCQTNTEKLCRWASIGWDTWCVENYLSEVIYCHHFQCFIPHESYITDVQNCTVLLWRPCILSWNGSRPIPRDSFQTSNVQFCPTQSCQFAKCLGTQHAFENRVKLADSPPFHVNEHAGFLKIQVGQNWKRRCSPVRLFRHLKLEAIPVPSQALLFLNICGSYIILPPKAGRLDVTLGRI
jgi:hypothetical protein